MKHCSWLMLGILLLPLLCFAAPAPPTLTVTEPTLTAWEFQGTAEPGIEVAFAAGAELNFSWTAEPATPSIAIVGYRYGWDLINPENPFDEGWVTVGHDPDLLGADPIVFETGIHHLHVEVLDDEGGVTRGCLILIENALPVEAMSWGAVKAVFGF